ncbi:MAG: hypothetical protein FWG88_05175 [Oscillospiraceae bacterium]|nr:hypothetical protein [Oscillospiraceae bacterium]
MKEYTVTFHLTEEQEKMLAEVAELNGREPAHEFEFIMQVGSAHLINEKLQSAKWFTERGGVKVRESAEKKGE